MTKTIELELRLRILEKITLEIIKNNPMVAYPDKSAIEQIRMESYQEMKQKYPKEIIEYPKD